MIWAKKILTAAFFFIKYTGSNIIMSNTPYPDCEVIARMSENIHEMIVIGSFLICDNILIGMVWNYPPVGREEELEFLYPALSYAFDLR